MVGKIDLCSLLSMSSRIITSQILICSSHLLGEGRDASMKCLCGPCWGKKKKKSFTAIWIANSALQLKN